MNLKSQLDSADLQKQQKEFKAQKEALDARERVLDTIIADTEAKLAILEGKIRVKESKLESIGLELSRECDNNDTEKLRLQKQTEAKKSELASIADKVLLQRDELVTSHGELDKVEVTLLGINTQIDARKSYLDEQESIISQAIEEANLRLHELRFEAEKIESDRVEHLKDIVRLEQNKDALDAELVEMDGKLSLLERNYEEKTSGYRDTLEDIKTDINTKKNELDQISVSISSKEQSIKTREKALQMKEAAIAKDGKDLAMKRRRLQSDYAVAGLNYEA